MNKYKWKGINYPSGKDDEKKYEKRNPTVAVNVLCVKDIYLACISKHDSNRGKQIIFLMILNGKGQHYLAVNKYLH